MFNTTEVPSLASVLDNVLEKAGVTIVPGKVTKEEGHLYVTFSIPSDMLAGTTAKEVFLLYLKPATKALGEAIIKYADGNPLYTKAGRLPDKDSKVLGWRCFKGRVPVNTYIARRMNPDRHQFIIEVFVQKSEE